MKKYFPLAVFCLSFLPGKTQMNYVPPVSSIRAATLPVDPALAGVQDAASVNMNAELYFEEEVKEHPGNASAWLNYYKAVRFRAVAMDLEKTFQKRLDSIDLEMSKKVPGSFEQFYVHYWNGNHDLSRVASLQNAYKLQPGNADVLRQLTGYNIIAGNKQQAAAYSAKWEKTGAMPAQLLPYAYNVLQSVPADAVLITNGEFDTYPIVQQQNANGVAAGVSVLPILLSARPENRARLFHQLGLKLPGNDSVSVFNGAYIRRIAAANPGKKIYIASSVGMGLLASLQKELYITGLAFRYSATPVENLAYLRENVGTKMKLDYLGQQKGTTAFDRGAANQLNMNYVLPLALAAQEYEAAGDKAKADELREKARSIGRQAGRSEDVNKLIGKP